MSNSVVVAGHPTPQLSPQRVPQRAPQRPEKQPPCAIYSRDRCFTAAGSLLQGQTGLCSAQPALAAAYDGPAAQPAFAAAYDGPTAQPVLAAAYDGPTAQPALAAAYDGPTAQPALAAAYDGPTAQPVLAAAYDGPTTQPALAAAYDRPTAQPAQKAGAAQLPAADHAAGQAARPQAGQGRPAAAAQPEKATAFEPFDDGRQQGALPDFPLDALPPILGDYARAIASSLQVPADMPAAVLLGAVALAVQGLYKISPKPGWLEPLNLFLVVVAKPSERKSPVLAEIARHIYDFCTQENERRAPDIAAYRIHAALLARQLDAMIAQASKPKKGLPAWSAQEIAAKQRELDELEAVKPLRLLADDVTPEALTSLLAANDGRMGVFSAEGGLFGILAGLYSQGSANIDTFLKAFTGECIQVDRKNRPAEFIPDPALTMCLMVQPSVLQQIMANRTFSGRGLLARFLYSLPKSQVGARQYNTPAIPAQVAQDFAGRLADLLQAQAAAAPKDPPQVICFTPEADSLANQFFAELEQGLVDELEDIEGWAGKLHGTTMRLAGVLHCAALGVLAAEEPVAGETMRAAIAIARYYMAHSAAAFRQMGAAEPPAVRDAKYIWKRLQNAGKAEISKGDVLRLCAGRLSASKMDPGLNELARRGYIRIATMTAGRGRHAVTIVLNPLAK